MDPPPDATAVFFTPLPSPTGDEVVFVKLGRHVAFDRNGERTFRLTADVAYVDALVHVYRRLETDMLQRVDREGFFNNRSTLAVQGVEVHIACKIPAGLGSLERNNHIKDNPDCVVGFYAVETKTHVIDMFEAFTKRAGFGRLMLLDAQKFHPKKLKVLKAVTGSENFWLQMEREGLVSLGGKKRRRA